MKKLLSNKITISIAVIAICIGGMAFYSYANNGSYIGEVEAKTLALAHANVNEDQIQNVYCELDYDDGIAIYDVEFTYDEKNFDFQINAKTGEIMEYDYDVNTIDTTTTETTETSESGTSEVTDSGASGSAVEETNTNSEYIGEDKAKELALNHASVKEADVAYVTCKFEIDDGLAQYDVEFYSGNKEYTYEINAKTGAILEYDVDTEINNSSQSQNTTTQQSLISEDKAKQIAIEHASIKESDITFITINLDYDDGITEYEIEWKIGQMEYDYTINAVTGAILEHEVQLDD